MGYEVKKPPESFRFPGAHVCLLVYKRFVTFLLDKALSELWLAFLIVLSFLFVD